MEVDIDTESFDGFISHNEELLIELDAIKEHPFEVNLEFDRRYRVWDKMVLRNRKFHLNTIEYQDELLNLLHRYVSLDINDVNRLLGRASKEFLDVANEREVSERVLILAKNLLWYRRRILHARIIRQLSEYEAISGEEIIHIFKNGWKELNSAKHGKISVKCK